MSVYCGGNGKSLFKKIGLEIELKGLKIPFVCILQCSETQVLISSCPNKMMGHIPNEYTCNCHFLLGHKWRH